MFYSLPNFSQDIHLLNTQQSLVYLNPSFAGSNGKIRLQNNYQTDYRGVYPFSTIRSCADFYVKALHGGIAFSFLHDNFNKGLQTTSMASLAYAQHLAFNEGKLKVIPSIEASYFKKQLDVNSISLGDLIDLRNNNIWINAGTLPQPEKTIVDMNAGLLVNYRALFA
ncbi:MAG: type IX secretion system membrane protein PorP/SprF, partial [Bacteroidia bacterium]|nr:type IX secretion system membrane protein PorP/SprF [Bacteroidia bacterium]